MHLSTLSFLKTFRRLINSLFVILGPPSAVMTGLDPRIQRNMWRSLNNIEPSAHIALDTRDKREYDESRLSAGFMLAVSFVFSLLAITSAQSADKLEVLDSYFFAELKSDDENDLRTKTTRIPNIPDKICFGWVINITPSDELAKITEIFTLPTAPKVWGGVEDDPYSQTTTTQDRTTATTNRFASLKKGRLENSWCLTKGDPSGDHHIVVLYGTQVLAEFEFEVYE